MKSLSNHRTSADENGDDVERAKPILQVVELITSLDMIVTFPYAGVQREYDFSDLYYHVYIYVGRRRFPAEDGRNARWRRVRVRKKLDDREKCFCPLLRVYLRNFFLLFIFFFLFLLSRSFR